MSEIYIELDLRLPISSASVVIELLSNADTNLTQSNLLNYFEPLGDSAQYILRKAVESKPEWVSYDLDLSEQISPQEFNHDGALAKIQFLNNDMALAGDMANFIASVFDAGGIDVANIEIYSEEDLDDVDDSDEEEDEFLHLDF